MYVLGKCKKDIINIISAEYSKHGVALISREAYSIIRSKHSN